MIATHKSTGVRYEIYFDSDKNEWRLRGKFVDLQLTDERMKKLEIEHGEKEEQNGIDK